MALDIRQRARITFRYDLIRGGCQGLLEAGMQTFVLLIAVRVYDASPTLKAILAGAGPYGLLLTPLSLYVVSRLQTPTARAAGFFLVLASLSFILAAWTGNVYVFVVATVLGYLLFHQQMPLLVHIYANNYEPYRRGALLSNSIFLAVIASVLFAYAGGKVLDADLGYHHHIVLVLAIASLLAAFAVYRMPSTPLSRQASRNPFASLNLAWKDKIFGWMLLIWMLMGIGNLMTLPLRVEYMAQPRFGINATNSQIALMTVVIPSIARLLTTHLWGVLFDRINFVIIRTALNSCFLAAILIFFNSHSLVMLGIASAIFGIGAGGAHIAWNLWVTKLAPEGQAAEYMGVHTFTTGIRGVLAPFLGFYLIATFDAQLVAWVAAVLIGISIVSLGPVKSRF